MDDESDDGGDLKLRRRITSGEVQSTEESCESNEL
jgi:hypothetical protein